MVIQGEWNLIFCADRPCDHNLFYRGSSLNFPLYLYTRLGRHLPDDLFVRENDKQANLAKAFVEDLAEKMDVNFVTDQRSSDDRVVKPEHVFHYSYALFHSPTYRTRYAEFLKIDFPRLPLSGNLELFRALARLGGDLAALHLMESPKLDKPITKWKGTTPSSEVEKITYADDTVWIDKAKTEGFRGVPENAWNFHIGGYQVCEKWLKDRKGRKLSTDDITHYQKIVVALNETIRIMSEIDEVIEQHGGWPIK